jgi:hypothetical protein
VSPSPGREAFFGLPIEPRRTRTDEAGRFALGNVLAGAWWLGPATPGGARSARLESSVPPGDGEAIPPRTIRVLVPDGGPEVQVDVGRSDAPSDGGGAISPRAIAVEVPAGEPEVGVVLDVVRGLTVRGRVVGPAGEPELRGVVGWYESRAGEWTARCDEDGSFVLGPLVPGELLIQVRDAFVSSDVLRVPAGTQGAVLHAPPTGSLELEVVDAVSGAPVPACVRLRRADEDPTYPADFLLADWDGPREGLAAGAYVAVARSIAESRVGGARVVVVPGVTSRARITLVPSARLYARCEGADVDGTYRVYSGGVLIASGATQPLGSTHLTVPSGALRVELRDAEGRTLAARNPFLKAGEMTRIAFRHRD